MPVSLRTFCFLLGALLAIGTAAECHAQSATPDAVLTDEQTKAIGQVIHDYIHNHPELIIETLEEAKEARLRIKEERAHQVLTARRGELLDDPTSPVAGNPGGDVAIVEFFDYRCPFCKAVQPSLDALLKQDTKLRIVYKEFPILGPPSVLATRVALAARKQDKYDDFHARMMATKGEAEITDQVVLSVAQSVGLDLDKLKTDMQAPEINAIIKHNYQLATALGIEGTPGIVIGNQIANGAADLAALKRMIASARSSE
jgi:protein-disulfide isomerase